MLLDGARYRLDSAQESKRLIAVRTDCRTASYFPRPSPRINPVKHSAICLLAAARVPLVQPRHKWTS
jgi:hypothetical protein